MKGILKKIDLPLLLMALILTGFGLIMIFSASNVSAVLRYDVSTTWFFTRQLIFIIFSLVVGFLGMVIIPLRKYRPLILLYSFITVLGLVLVFTFGKVAGGARSWYSLGIFNIQPTEFVKTALILFLALYYSYIYNKKLTSPTFQFIPLIITFVIALLIYLQSDAGGAFIVCMLMFLIFITLPDQDKKRTKYLKLLLIGAGIFAVVLFYAGSNLVDSYQINRLKFRNPCSRYIDDTGYQVCNGFIAIHNGGLLGRGLGNSTQKYLYLPEAHTDFIFPIICEELGCVVGALVVVCFGFILFRILNIARESKTIFSQVIAYGTFYYILIHILINLGGVLGLMPLTGVPLPFLSYGGSYILNLLMMIFIVERVAIENKKGKK